MKPLYTILLTLLAALALIWGITSLGDMTAPKGDYVPFTLYSEVVEEFASLDNRDGEGTRYYDYAGREYTDSEFDSILPSFYYRQLVMDGRLPDSIRGIAVDQGLLERESFIFVSHPASLNTHETPLYFLLESMSKRVNLEMPEDVFRFTDRRIEFVNMESNSIEEEKSALYQRALEEKGVTFPIRLVAGNPTTRKAYDNGYLLVDAADRLYQLRQTVGRPFVRAIDLPEGVRPEYLFVTEYPAKRFLGFVVDREGSLYVIRLPEYRLQRADLPTLRMREEKLTILGNPFFWTVIQSNAEGAEYTALDARTLEGVKSLHFDTPGGRTFADYIVPFQLRFESGEYNYLHPTISQFSWIGTLVWLLAIGGIAWYRRRK